MRYRTLIFLTAAVALAACLSPTDACGRFRLFLAAASEAPAGCILVRARAPLASGPAVFVDTVVTLALRYRPPLDSARWTPVLTINPAGAGP